MKTWLMGLLALLMFTSSLPAMAADSDAVIAASEACKSAILTVNSGDIDQALLENVKESCDDFPLSDSMAAQVVAAIIGEDLLVPLDVFTFVTGIEHGFESGDSVFMAVESLHDVLSTVNDVVFYTVIGLLVITLLFKAFSLIRGDQRSDLGQEIGVYIPAKVGRLLLTMPVVGWMTPFQLIGVTLLFLAFIAVKQLVIYLFIFGFASDVAIGVTETTKEGLTHELGDNILMYHCDIKRRENILEVVQMQYGSRDAALLRSDPVFQCLTESAPSNMAFTDIEVTDAFSRVRGTPPTLAKTESCIENNRLHWEKTLGGDALPSCGQLTLNVPTNKASSEALSKLKGLTTSPATRESLRAIAVQLYQYQCQKAAAAEDYTGAFLSHCIALEATPGGYRYITMADPVTGQEKLSAYTSPMTTETRRQAIDQVRMSVESVRSQLLDNNAAMLGLLRDMAAPKLDSENESTGLQDEMDAGTQLISDEDAEAMVLRIRRGAWAGGSLFFDKISSNLAESTLVGALSKIYQADLPDDEGVIESTYRDLTDSLDLVGLTRGVNASRLDEVSRRILPMVGLYDYQKDCWIDASSCQAVPINPFYYTIKDGIKILERSLVGLSMSAGAELVLRKLGGLGGRREPGGHAKLQLFSVIGDYFWLYAIYGLMLAVIIPAFPFFKLLAMLFSWAVDVLVTLFSANAKIALSTINGDEPGQLFSRDVRDAFRTVIGQALYFVFLLVGVMVFFFMFTALFAFNVIVLGVLESILQVYGPFTMLDMALMRVIVDGIMVALLVYEVRICMPYMESIPKDMAKHFSLDITPNDEIVHMMWSKATGWMPNFADTVRSAGSGAGQQITTLLKR